MNELYKYFEDVKFGVMLNVCSGFKCIKHGLQGDPNINKMICEMDEWGNQLELYDRINELIPISGLEAFEHPYDMALTAYLYVLSKTNMALAVLASRFVKDTPRLFWAYKMAKELRT